MSPQLSLLPGDTPDDIDLDLLELGAISDGLDRARVEASRTGPLAEADQELADARAFFNAHATPLRPHPPSSSWVQRAWPWASALALAASLFLVFLATRPSPTPDRYLPMGSLQVDVANATERLNLVVRSPGKGFLDVWTRQEDGSVSALMVGRPVHPGERFKLTIALDDYDGEEWLMAQFTDQPSSEEALLGRRHTDLDPGRSFAVEVTRRP
ncbi:MAG: hypothetical protein AAGA48_02415 [Myxococcota bacterium]